jgi:hypothetical protein
MKNLQMLVFFQTLLVMDVDMASLAPGKIVCIEGLRTSK